MPTPMIPGIPPLLPLGIRRNSREPAGTLSPEEEESLAKKAGKIGLGGIAALGNLIDLPGSMVRDVMVGENPLDQLLHPFSGESRTYGRDMLRKAGMIGQKDTLLNALPGLAIDIATDPLTWIMPFGALTKAGKVVKQAGMLPKVRNIAARLYDDAGAHAPGVIVPGAPRRAAPSGARLGEMGPRRAAVRTTLRDVLGFASPEELTALKRAAEASGSTLQQLADQPLRGMFATGAFGNPWRVMASGPRGEKVAQFLDRAQQAVVHGKVPHTNFAPVERMAQLFNARIGGAPGDVAGYFGKLAFGAKESARAAANTKVAEFANSLVKAGISTPEQMDLVRRALEEIPVTSREVILRNPATPAAAAAAQTAMSQLPPEVQEILRKAQAYKQQIFDSVKAEGGRISEYASPEALHWPRYGLADEFPEQQFQSGAGISRSFDVRNQSAARRNPIFSPYESPQGMKYGIKDETTTIRQMLMDDEINLAIDTYETPEVVANIIRRKYGNKIPRLFNEVNGTAGDRYNALAKWAANLSPEQRKFGFFANDPLRDLHSYAVVGAGQAASLRVLREFLQSKGVMHFPGSAARQAGWHELGDVLQKVAGHIDRDVFGKHLLDDTLRAMTPQEVAGFRHSLAASLGKPIQELTDADMIGVVMKSRMSDDSATAIQRLAMGFSRPEPANAILQVFDSMTNLWKNFQTGVFPAFHTRNLISGQVNNWFAGNWSRESVKMTRDLLRGGTVKGASQLDAVKQLAAQRGIASLTDEQATQLLGELAYAHNMTGRYAGEAMSQAGVEAISRPQQLGDLMREIPRPGYQAMSGKRLINKLLGREPGTSWKPWDVRGVRGRAESSFTAAAAGEEAGHVVESFNRIAPFIHQLKRGVDPAEAARVVGATQAFYDTRYFTPFEREVMQRAFPFYKFTRHMFPWMITELTERPGGRLAQVIRGTARLRNPSAITPDYVAETMAIPMGQDPEGGQRYLTGAGLMFEDPVSFFGAGVRGAALETASRLNPLLRMPLEWGTGQQFFQKGPQGGRPLEDLDPTVGRLVANLTGQRDAVRAPGGEAMEFLLGNLVGRPLTTARTMSYPVRALTDPMMKGQFLPEVARTAANVLTGFRVTNVSPAAQDALLRERTQRMMRSVGSKMYVKSYIPAEVEADMTASELADAKKLEALMNTLSTRAKQRKEALKEAEQSRRK